MIDIHTHILPGVDDGARDSDEALRMARIAAEDGITHLFATPHHQMYHSLSRQTVADLVAQLQAHLDAANIPLTLLPGHEVRLDRHVFSDWDNGTAGPLGHSRYVLAEPLFNRYNGQTDHLLRQFFDRGYIPVMAHPERIGPIQADLSLIEPFLDRGGLTQITAHSLTGAHGRRAREVAEEMLRRGMVHIIASDAHRPHRRRPILSEAYRIAAAIVGETRARTMVAAAPMAIVKDEPVMVDLAAA